MKLDPYLTQYTKINSKWTKDLNIKAETIKIIGKKKRKKLCDVGFSTDFLDMTPKIKAKRNK